MRYFLKLSYKGTEFHGWQEQANSPNTIQEICSESISKILNEKVKLHGAGRTDAGVHAEVFYAHFDSSFENLAEEKYKWLYKFNSIVPYSIAFNDIFKVQPTAHARFDATARTYKYIISLKRNPFLYGNSMFLTYPVDIEKMNLAAKKLHHYREFSSFKKNPNSSENKKVTLKTDFCAIKQATWETKNDCLIFTIIADRFLRNMVRAIVGTMLNVGNGKISVNDFCNIIESKNRSKAGASVPAHGLYLTNIEYPAEIFIS